MIYGRTESSRRTGERQSDILTYETGPSSQLEVSTRRSGVNLLGSVVFATVVEQERLVTRLPILARLLVGAISTSAYAAVFALLGTNLWSSFGLLGALTWLGLVVDVLVLWIRYKRKRMRRATKLVVGGPH
jgi:hypothetical protein